MTDASIKVIRSMDTIDSFGWVIVNPFPGILIKKRKVKHGGFTTSLIFHSFSLLEPHIILYPHLVNILDIEWWVPDSQEPFQPCRRRDNYTLVRKAVESVFAVVVTIAGLANAAKRS